METECHNTTTKSEACVGIAQGTIKDAVCVVGGNVGLERRDDATILQSYYHLFSRSGLAYLFTDPLRVYDLEYGETFFPGVRLDLLSARFYSHSIVGEVSSRKFVHDSCWSHNFNAPAIFNNVAVHSAPMLIDVFSWQEFFIHDSFGGMVGSVVWSVLPDLSFSCLTVLGANNTVARVARLIFSETDFLEQSRLNYGCARVGSCIGNEQVSGSITAFPQPQKNNDWRIDCL